MKVSLNSYAKINLSLNIIGTNNGFHNLDTVVASINLYDKITVSERRDNKIKLKMQNGDFCISDEQNNAYKSAKLFCDTFGTNGVDISIKKGIPIGGGLGGSSADIAGVLNAMAKLYDISEDLKPLADKLGSDSGYMLKGGFARLKGRGENVEFLPDCKRLWLVLVVDEDGVSTSECFREFDLSCKNGIVSDNNELIAGLNEGNLEIIGKNCNNALFSSASKINPNVKANYDALKSLSPSAVSMSGSGSTIFGIYETEELCMWAGDKLKRQFKNVILTHTL